jgi:predicted amidohydrolase YtcJ
VLDIFEDILTNGNYVNTTSSIEKRKVDVNEWRPRIEHAQIMTGEDVKRLGRLGGKRSLFFHVFRMNLGSYTECATYACDERYVVRRDAVGEGEDEGSVRL